MADDITGSVAVEVFPVAKGWVAKLEPQILQGSDALAQKLADKLASRIPNAIGDAIGRGLDQSGVKAKVQGGKQGEQFGSAFGKAMQTRLKAALDNLPTAKLGVDATDADRRLAQLRRNIETLSKTVGVHVSDKAAAAAIEHLRAELAKLQHGDNTLSIRVNAGAASAELAALQAQLDTLSNGETPAGSEAGASLPSLPITALLTALPLIGPLAGAATGALGGVVGAGGAAGLAIKGLNNEIKAGTGLGHQFSVELGGLHGDLASLESTAAHASAGGFLTALDELHKYAPQLRPLVAGIAADLGQAGATTAHALISALKTAAPLLADGGRYAELLATKLDSAAQSPQFRQFINYARQELPIVGKDLADLVKTAADLATSLQPIGDQLLSRLDKITVAADRIPAIIDKLNRIPGVGTKGGKGLSGILGSAASHVTNPVASVVDLLPGGKKGSAPQVATDPAVAARSAAVAAAARAQDAALIHTVQVLGTTIPAYRAAAAAQAQDAAQLAITTEKMVQQNSASGLLKQALDKLDGKQLFAAQSQNQFEQALVSMAQKIGKGDAAVQGLTSSAVANRGELLNLVTAAESAAGTTGDLASSSDAAKAKLIQLRQQIINNAVAHGEDRDAVTKYINTVLDINKLQVTPTLLDRATDKVMAQLAAIRAEVTKTVLFIDGQVPVLHVSTYNPATKATFGGKAVTPAAGGFITGPGTGTSDSIHAFLSNGEFVVRAAQTAKHRALLENLNRGTAGFADGGIVTITPSPTAGKSAAAAANSKAQALATAQANIRFTTSLDVSGLAKAALGSTGGIAAIIRKLITDVHTAAAKGVGSNALITVLQKDNTKLQALANQRVTLTGKLKAADNLLTAERKLFSDEQAKVAASVASVFDITNVNGPTPVGTANPALFLKNLQAEANQANKFAAQLTQLRKSGLDKALIAQLGEAGVGGAGQAVQSLASFTPAQIAQVNALQAKVAASSQVAGNSVASALYQAGIDSAEGYVKGLNSKLSSVNQAATDLANTVIKQIKKTLGIHSPSTVAHALAGNTVQGWVNGVDDRLHLVSGAAGRLANAAVQPGQFGRSGGKGIRDYHQHLHMQPGVDPRSFLADARRELAREMK